jgi:diguanylate cyclase (GGDEF)-like protein/PAS domain S-box-containing protein
MAIFWATVVLVTQRWMVGSAVWESNNSGKLLFPILWVDFSNKMINSSENLQLFSLNQSPFLTTWFGVATLLSFGIGWFVHQFQTKQKQNQVSQPADSFASYENDALSSIFLKSDQNYQSLAEFLAEAFLVFTNNQCVYINSAGVQLFGASGAEEILGKSPLELGFLLEKNREQTEQNPLKPAIQTLVRFDNHQPISVEVHSLTLADAQQSNLLLIILPVETENLLISQEAKTALFFSYQKAIHSTQLQTDEPEIEVTNNFHQFETQIIKSGMDEAVCIVREITEPKQVEKILNEQEEHYRRLVERSPDGIFVVQNGIFYFVNTAFVLMLGAANPQDLVGRHFSDFIHSDFHQNFLKRHHLDDQQEFQTHVSHEKIIRLDGTEIDVEVAETQIELKGQLASQFVVRNITERKQVEVALQTANAELKERVNELQERNEEIILLSYMSDLLQACLNLNEAYIVIAQMLPLLFPNSSGRLFRLTESKNLLESVAVWGNPQVTQGLFCPQDCMALRRGQPHLVEDRSRSLLCNHILSPTPAATFCIPMVAQGEATGLLHFSFPEKGLLSKPKQQLAITVSRQIALALANLKLYETLQHQSIRDPLTGLFNRRYLEESLKREIHRSERNHQTLGIIMIDVDHFKQFNDSFGHDAGDTVLCALGLFIKGQIRESDIACRYGGEELVLILPETSLETTQRRAEQIRASVKHLSLQHRRQSLGTITISVGVACFPEHGITTEAVIRAADIALYQAKKQGRDQVMIASTS